MLEKRPRSGNTVEVTFRMPPLDDVVELYLCGDFNDWHTSGAPMVQEPDGSWVGRLILESGKSYRFRYYDNQGRWHNDWDADAYVPNAFGTEDSVVDLAAPLKNTSAADLSHAASRGRGGRGSQHRRPGAASVSGGQGGGGAQGRNRHGRSGGNGRGGNARGGNGRGNSGRGGNGRGGGPRAGGGPHGGRAGGGKPPRGR